MTLRAIRSIKNILSAFLIQFTTFLFGFVIKNLLINKLGVEYMGLNTLMVNLLNTLNLAELGFDTVFLYCLYKPFAEQDTQTVNAILNFFRKIYFFIGSVILVIGIGLSFFLKKFISGAVPYEINIYFIYFLYLLNTIIGYFCFAYKKCILRVAQRLNVLININLVFLFPLYTIQIYAIYKLKNYYLFVVILPIIGFLTNLVYSLYIDKHYPQYKCEGELSKEFYKDFFKKLYAIAFVKLRTASRSYIDTVIISALLGLIVTAKYSAYQSVVTVVIILSVWVIIPSLKDSIGNYFVSSITEGRIEILNTFTFIIFWVASWCSICFVCLCQDFITTWVGAEMLENNFIVFSFAFLCFIQAIAAVPECVKEITGVQWQNRYCPLFEMAFNIGLDLLLVKQFGVPGIVFATALCIGFITLPSDVYVIFKYCFNRSCKKYIILLVIYTLITFILCIICQYLASFIVLNNLILQLLLKFLFCIIIPNLILFLCFCRTKIFRNSKKIIFASLFPNDNLD